MSRVLFFGKYFARLVHRVGVVGTVMWLIACSDKAKMTIYEEDVNGGSCENVFVLSGRISAGYEYILSKTTAFYVQLIEGRVHSDTLLKRNYRWEDAQVFVTEKNNDYQFDKLKKGDYTLCITKRGFKPIVECCHVDRDIKSWNFYMERDPDAGFTNKVQVLDEKGNDLSELKFDRNTQSVLFYLFNGTGREIYCGMWAIPNDSYLVKNFIIDGEVVNVFSSYVKEIRMTSNAVSSNELRLVEVIIDPLVYMIKEHASCRLLIDHNGLELTLSY